MVTSCIIQYLFPLIPFNEYMCWLNGTPPNLNPPYVDDLYPILPNEGVCGIANQGGRWNKFDDTVDAIDQIGDETRPLKPDACIVNDGKGGAVILDSTLTLTKWAVGFRIADYVKTSSLAIVIGGLGRQNIWLNRSGFFNYRAGDGSQNSFDGTSNSIITEPIDGSVEGFVYSDGVNVYLTYKGLSKGYVTPSTTILVISKLIQGYSNSSNAAQGDHFGYRIYDLSARTPDEINT